jgi:hypothetical protein
MELNLCYKGQVIHTVMSIDSFNIDFLKKLFTPENLAKVLTSSNINTLSQFVPKNNQDILNDPQKLSNLLLNTTTKFDTPINDFYQKYLHNFFTANYQNYREVMNIENAYDFMNKRYITHIQLQNLLTKVQNNAMINTITNNNTNQNNNIEISPNVLLNTHINNNNMDNITTTFDMHSELASSGYTSLEVDKESKHSLSRKNSGNIGPNQDEKNNLNNSKMKDIDNNFNNILSKSGNKNKSINDNNSYMVDPSDENDSFIDRNILKSDRFKNVKKNKIQITIKSRTKEEIQSFREQEKERYKHPHSPWEYTLSNGLGQIKKIWDLDEIKKIYSNIIIVDKEDGTPEMCFNDIEIADRFVEVMSELSILYMDDKTRFGMQFLADIMKRMSELKLITVSDLYELSEKEIIDKIKVTKDYNISDCFKKWQEGNEVKVSEEEPKDKYSVKVKAKKRYIDPLVKTEDGIKRISEVSEKAKNNIDNCLNYTFDRYTYMDFNFTNKKVLTKTIK